MTLHRTAVFIAGMAPAMLGASPGALPATAEKAMVSVQEKFGLLDIDRDGFLSRSEARQLRGYSRAFTEADQNRDGRLDADEFIKAEAIHDREQAAAYLDDGVITAKVKAALFKQARLKAFSVHVETYRGHVLLSGMVDDAKQRNQAIQAASSVRGVLDVKDALAFK
jgi:hypothetical protein